MSPSVEKGAAIDADRHKREAAERAVESIQPGMVVGLGTGSTAAHVVHRLAALRSEGKLLDVKGVPTSRRTEALAESLGVPLTTLEAHPVLDLCIDGADEVDPALRLIKGGGGALLREKIVAQASRRLIIVVDEGKLSPRLGTRWAVPVEVVPFGWRSQALYLEGLGARVTQRLGPEGSPFVTDQGHFILDCAWGALEDPEALAARLQARAGLVEHGLFLGMTSELIVAGSRGVEVRHPG
ncbi:Ribose 5-phosphate isomerase A [Cystobacter fuscus DSM 2262]|uniref:Ribose-5-phosphate isomerase A n=1 Tax=Cystobacter fuscus (strain ATCC 25194 / DSM 2262 / NBRC 100088 / M29) TaxID=1242864 RepID=S9QV31_CYSF2|nr:ribose-5-phosphate isomerase RpiA [Cystobacter fuscus]EPX60518.1 Ribose 5-phosphate isomerase A [Cystobacter fuscus DSM 2262]